MLFLRLQVRKTEALHVYAVLVLYLFLKILCFLLTGSNLADNLAHLRLSHLKLRRGKSIVKEQMRYQNIK